MWHLLWINLFGYEVAHEQGFCFRVVDDIMNLLSIEFVKDGHSHSTIGEGGEEGDSPMGGIASANGYFVSLFDTAVLEDNMQFFYLSCHIMKLKRSTLVISQGIGIPVFDDGVVNEFIKTRTSGHCTIFKILCKGTLFFAQNKKNRAVF